MRFRVCKEAPVRGKTENTAGKRTVFFPWESQEASRRRWGGGGAGRVPFSSMSRIRLVCFVPGISLGIIKPNCVESLK